MFHASVAVSEKDASCAREVADRFNETFRPALRCTGSDSFSSYKQSYVKAGTTETRPELSLGFFFFLLFLFFYFMIIVEWN